MEANQHATARARVHPSTMRRLRAPTVGTRAAGHLSHVADEFQRIYFGATSDFGRLNDSIWYRIRANSYSARADAWRVSSTLCGHQIHLDAVIDDFGSLIAIDE